MYSNKLGLGPDLRRGDISVDLLRRRTFSTGPFQIVTNDVECVTDSFTHYFLQPIADNVCNNSLICEGCDNIPQFDDRWHLELYSRVYNEQMSPEQMIRVALEAG